MEVVNYTEFRLNLKNSLDAVTQDAQTIIINRGKNDNAVLLSLKEYNSMLETIHLSSSEKNLQRLNEAIEREKTGVFETHNLID
ncbi:MAG: type II toxin-antitoxin system Phd/YefM family antitoxin [Cytophagaceae bacterium]|nr:type II toxin-antitoxin system Phd/YefM family antitoxin [Cytophagaceae bacterium]MBK9935551.1 type II toxin-antitoxin system Phd/YefM family antitoxin [Cytophagaceae bacterium]MBL0301993.1 type II toxin-antitoxin system Phd/YefM family antitoxin [Cytophagaceae bacterium]MBL0324818.1 type II toxin-antitoxin system Phd/YefM family antitoxin [Cytophagaceae bacterium]